MVDESTCALVVIIDTNRVWWGEKSLNDPQNSSHQFNGASSSSQQITISDFVDSVITFSNAHLLVNNKNRLAIIASHANRSQYIYPPRDGTEQGGGIEGGASSDTLHQLRMCVKGELSHLLSEVDDREMDAQSVTAGAFCMALCHLNKVEQAMPLGEKLSSKILVIKGTEDSSDQYMNFMNATFTAQKKNIVIDACVFESRSSLLQQACDITNGIYLEIPNSAGLLQYLMWVFLPDARTRSKMGMPSSSHVDYRAACFCHRNLIDRGFVCSVCLSIFCNFQAICSTCSVPFRMFSAPVLKKKVKKAVA